MNKEILSEKEQLFLYLVGTFHSSARIALGKNENPMTKSININKDPRGREKPSDHTPIEIKLA